MSKQNFNANQTEKDDRTLSINFKNSIFTKIAHQRDNSHDISEISALGFTNKILEH